jgi:hypothetical protein
VDVCYSAASWLYWPYCCCDGLRLSLKGRYRAVGRSMNAQCDVVERMKQEAVVDVWTRTPPCARASHAESIAHSSPRISTQTQIATVPRKSSVAIMKMSSSACDAIPDPNLMVTASLKPVPSLSPTNHPFLDALELSQPLFTLQQTHRFRRAHCQRYVCRCATSHNSTAVQRRISQPVCPAYTTEIKSRARC